MTPKQRIKECRELLNSKTLNEKQQKNLIGMIAEDERLINQETDDPKLNAKIAEYIKQGRLVES